MNALNILSASVLGHNRPVPQRAQSSAEIFKRTDEAPAPQPKRSHSHYGTSVKNNGDGSLHWLAGPATQMRIEKKEEEADDEIDEGAPLLGNGTTETAFLPESKPTRSRGQLFVQKLAGSLIESFRWFFGKLLAPGFYLVALFYNEEGLFSPLMPFHRLTGQRAKSSASESNRTARKVAEKRQLRSTTKGRSTSWGSSDSEGDKDSTTTEKGTGHISSSDESTTSRRSIRIRQNEETVRRRKQKKKPETAEEAIAKELKSPTSPASSLRMTKYPHAPTPPRPLIPRRQPSYSSISSHPAGLLQKTLVLDLDETLIHSMAKGGRMSRGHMVEVKLAAPTAYNGVALGPQHPILYYVHKRPFCDEFLRQVSKWYNLVIFTASVQEYADPVIDWLELERKYFSKRYYRQHCTFRTGAYIKDLGTIEPDLSRVMILDNSPLSYIFHEDNAIPIEGWINDPTDNDLMHLIPLLEGLQHVTDVRAFLGLRRGEASQEIK